MKKIKLLVVTPYFYPKIGGLENYAFNIAKNLMKNYNYEVVVITSNHESKEYKEENLEGMKIYRLPYQFKVSNTPISFKWKRQIKEIIEKENPDIINAHSPVPFISDVACRVAHKKKIPFLLTYHAGSMKKENAFIKNLIIGFYENINLKKTLDYSNKIVCCSDFVRNEFLKDYKNKSITITPAVDIKLFKPLDLKEEKNRVLFVGNFGEQYLHKGLNYLINALGKSKGIKLVVIGEGDKKQIKEVEFIGIKKGKELVEEINKSSILILPSTSNAESFGMVLIEAMACKKPVIGSNIGGIPYVIDDGVNGLLVPPKNSQALTDAITKILSNPKLAKQMGENGYKKVKDGFTWDELSNKMDKIFGGL